MKSNDDKTENKPLHQKNLKRMTREERSERVKEILNVS
jgi:hypothetical protein